MFLVHPSCCSSAGVLAAVITRCMVCVCVGGGGGGGVKVNEIKTIFLQLYSYNFKDVNFDQGTLAEYCCFSLSLSHAHTHTHIYISS